MKIFVHINDQVELRLNDLTYICCLVTVLLTEEKRGGEPAISGKLSVKRARPKAASPNRQGPQQCQVCSKVFGNASALAKHKLTHSDERKYVCSMCGKAFKRQDHLNGHMLTHRNKKPYECKADGCGKSYCDARSLRRHTENHHSAGASSGSSSSASSSSPSPAAGDAASPHGATCIQYAPAPAPTAAQPKSQLQQLLAAEPASAPARHNNDGLTKHQLDLIHQIMEQTRGGGGGGGGGGAGGGAGAGGAHAGSKQPAQRGGGGGGTQAKPAHRSPPSSKAAVPKPEPPPQTTIAASTVTSRPSAASADLKPVECNLCHRKFKNIPALNGHMRLHGGYFKKVLLLKLSFNI